MSKITYIANAAENPDNVLRKAIGEYESVFIIGYKPDGNMDARASMNLPCADVVFLLEAFKHFLFDGQFETKEQ